MFLYGLQVECMAKNGLELPFDTGPVPSTECSFLERCSRSAWLSSLWTARAHLGRRSCLLSPLAPIAERPKKTSDNCLSNLVFWNLWTWHPLTTPTRFKIIYNSSPEGQQFLRSSYTKKDCIGRRSDLISLPQNGELMTQMMQIGALQLWKGCRQSPWWELLSSHSDGQHSWELMCITKNISIFWWLGFSTNWLLFLLFLSAKNCCCLPLTWGWEA